MFRDSLVFRGLWRVSTLGFCRAQVLGISGFGDRPYDIGFGKVCYFFQKPAP